jgi:cephalosporin-C deacetylase-like acetyl esterase
VISDGVVINFLTLKTMGMGRREGFLIKCLFLSVLFILGLSSMAQDQKNVMNWKTESTLRTYLLQLMHQQYDLRQEELSAALKSKAAIEQYRTVCREKYHHILGDFPEKTPLNIVLTNRLSQNGYSIENIIFESRPGHHVTSNIYIPDKSGPLPAVLLFCGHEMTSKATESYQKTAVLFATNGFVVMVVDPISQGERVQFTDSLGVRILRGSTTEHTLLDTGANLVGTSVAAWELYDNVRALDYLCSRSEVDTSRVGCLGNSGGGTQTAYFIAFDDRIKVAAPCSYIARRERNFELSGAADGCQHIPYEGSEHLEMGDFLIMFAPKPLLILAGKYDFVDYTGTVETYKELSTVYDLYETKEKIDLFTYEDGHGISLPKREAVVEWFIRWLRDDKVRITEGTIPVLDEKKLNCTTTGQVNSYFPEEKDVQDFSLKEAHDLVSSRGMFMEKTTLPQKQQKLKELLAIDNIDSGVKVETKEEEQYPEYNIKKIILRRDGEVPLPCLCYTPDKTNGNDTIIIWLNEAGKNEIASRNELLLPLITAGNSVILADLRGMGETAEKAEANDWKYYNREYNNAMLGLHIGKPLPGQRTEDIHTILKYISGLPGKINTPVKIIATGAAAPSALYAAVLWNEIQTVEGSSTIKSYFEILENPMEKDWYSYVIPGVLRCFDLKDIAALRPDLKVIYK